MFTSSAHARDSDVTVDDCGAHGDHNDNNDSLGDSSAPANAGDDDDGAVGTEPGQATSTATPRRRRKISDSDNDDSDGDDDDNRTAPASTASVASHAQPIHATPNTDDNDDDGAVAEGQPALITSFLPIGMTMSVYTYGKRRSVTITWHAPNGDVEFRVPGSGVWRSWHETRPPSFFGIGPTTPLDEGADGADPSASDSGR